MDKALSRSMSFQNVGIEELLRTIGMPSLWITIMKGNLFDLINRSDILGLELQTCHLIVSRCQVSSRPLESNPDVWRRRELERERKENWDKEWKGKEEQSFCPTLHWSTVLLHIFLIYLPPPLPSLLSPPLLFCSLLIPFDRSSIWFMLSRSLPISTLEDSPQSFLSSRRPDSYLISIDNQERVRDR